MNSIRNLDCRSNRIHIAAEYPISVHDVVSEFTDFDFLIATIAGKNSSYRDLFKQDRRYNRYRVVDSGIFEDPQNPITPTRQVDISLDLDADEVVIIDHLNDCAKTLNSLYEFMNLAPSFPFKIQGVVQGKSLLEWLYCYDVMEKHPRVDVIGVSYCEVPTDLADVMTDFGVNDSAETARLTLLGLIAGGMGAQKTESGKLEFYHRGPIQKPLHLLGLRTPRAIPYYRTMPFCRSLDTSFPVQLGVEGRPLHLGSPKPEYKVNFVADVIRAEKSLIAENVMRFLRLCRGEEDFCVWEATDRLISGNK